MPDILDNKLLALNYIKQQIITCAMPPGSVVPVDEIAAQLGISKTPVREALLELQHDNYGNVVPRKRTTVSQISLQDLRDIYDARSLVEIHMIRTLPPEVLEKKQESLLRLRAFWDNVDMADSSRETYLAFLDADVAFHKELVRLNGNAHLVRFCDELILKSQRFWYMALFNNRRDLVQREHLQILDCLLHGDAQGAADSCQKHISISKTMSILSD